MITRLRIDNWGPLLDFEWWPKKHLNLLMGGHGTGKSFVLDAIDFVKILLSENARLKSTSSSDTVNKWSGRAVQTIEMNVELGNTMYLYYLELSTDELRRCRIVRESLHADGEHVVTVAHGKTAVYGDDGKLLLEKEASTRRSGVGSTTPTDEMKLLAQFLEWSRERLHVFMPNLQGAVALLEKSGVRQLDPELVDFAPWYASWSPKNPEAVEAIRRALSEVIHGFAGFQVCPDGSKLQVLFGASESTTAYAIDFHCVSDGERQLCALYTLLHAYLRPGHTVLIDAPTNFVPLREVQPWLNEVIDVADVSGGPQVFLVSHHPEIIDQIAPDCGTRLVRDDGGPTRILPFRSAPELSASETVARGWED